METPGPHPTDLLVAGQRRLLLVVVLIGVAHVVYTALYLTIWIEHAQPIGEALGFAGIGLSAIAAFVLKSGVRSRRFLSFVGVGYLVCISYTLSLSEYCSSVLIPDQPANRISWVCVIIVLLPFVAPTTPRGTLFAAFLAALSIPVSYGIARVVGIREALSGTTQLSIYLPPLMCAVVAYFPSRVLDRLGTELNRARQLGSYELVERIGSGGMGEVWRAKHHFLARPAAIKLVKHQSSDSPEALERFEREAQATAMLKSPHTVDLYDFGVSGDGALYYVMELLSGVDLETLVGQTGRQKSARVVHFLLQACDSLAEAHDSGLIHRDIKPANLFTSQVARRYDVIKVLDFGLVKGSPDGVLAGEALETSQAVIRGTPAYLAPETISGTEVDARADLYALGCVGFFLLTGETVFPHKTAMEMAVAHATEVPRAPSDLDAEAKPLDSIIGRLLAKDPNDRYATADALAQALRDLDIHWTQDQARAWWIDHPDLKSDSTPQSKAGPTILVPHKG